MFFKTLLANIIFYTGHYTEALCLKLVSLGIRLHVKFKTPTGLRIIQLQKELLRSALKEQVVEVKANKYPPSKTVVILGDK